MSRLWYDREIGHVRVSVVRAKEVGHLVPVDPHYDGDEAFGYGERDEDQVIVIAKSSRIMEVLREVLLEDSWQFWSDSYGVLVELPIEEPTFQKASELFDAYYREEWEIPFEVVSAYDWLNEELKDDLEEYLTKYLEDGSKAPLEDDMGGYLKEYLAEARRLHFSQGFSSYDERRAAKRALIQFGKMPGYVRKLPGQKSLITEDFLLLVEDDEECLRAAVQFLIDCNVDEKLVPNWRRLADLP